MELYPNPSSETFHIEYDKPINRLIIYDSIGKIVKQFNHSQLDSEYNISNLQKGIYFIKLMSNDNRIETTIKFIKN